MINRFKHQIEKYVPVSDDVWKTIERASEIVNLKNKEILINYGELNKNGYFLAQGSLEMSLISSNGDTKTVWFFLDEVFYMIATGDSIFLDEPTKYQITALEDSVLYKVHYEVFESWSKQYQEISEFMRRDLLNDYVISHEIRNHMVSHSPVDFITYLNQKFPAILRRIPDKNIAQFMGITPEWYSKVKKKVGDLN